MAPSSMRSTATTNSGERAEPVPIQIVPQPRSVQRDTDKSLCCARLALGTCSEELRPAWDHLQEAGLDSGDAPPVTVAFTLDANLDHPEAYRLQIGSDDIHITAAAPAGAFYAAQSLIQLWQAGKVEASAWLPVVDIHDQPAYQWRGMHLDCSRHFFDIEFVKRYIDLLALHKYNRFHWHFCDDQGWRLQSETFGRLTEVGAWRERSVVGHTANRERTYEEQRHGGYYSHEDIREVVRYAGQRHIEVVPEIDIPGHGAALLAAYPELSCQGGEYRVEEHYGIFPDVLCPSEKTFEFLRQLFTELADLFPYEYVHIGGDEVIKDAWRQCPSCQALMQEKQLHHVDQLHGYFVQRVEAILADLGKRAIAWNEVMEGDVSTATTIMCWTGLDACRDALLAGHQTIMTPVECTYFDFYQSTSLDEPQAIHGLATLKDVFDYDPLPPGVTEELRSNILGAQANVWTEYLRTPHAVEYACLPRMSALAEVTWTGPERDWNHFCERLPGLLQYLELRHYTVAHSVYKPRITTGPIDSGLELTLACDMPGMDIYYTLDGSKPGPDSPRYDQPLQINHNSVLRACSVEPVTGQIFGDERAHLAIHKALHRPLYRLFENQMTPAEDLSRLTDGRLGTERIFHGFEWTQFTEEHTDLAVDLGSATEVLRVELNFEAGAHRTLFFPSQVEILVSRDGACWDHFSTVTAAQISESGSLALEADPVVARYVRLKIDNSDTHYGPEQRRLITRPVHLDELVVH